MKMRSSTRGLRLYHHGRSRARARARARAGLRRKAGARARASPSGQEILFYHTTTTTTTAHLLPPLGVHRSKNFHAQNLALEVGNLNLLRLRFKTSRVNLASNFLQQHHQREPQTRKPRVGTEPVNTDSPRGGHETVGSTTRMRSREHSHTTLTAHIHSNTTNPRPTQHDNLTFHRTHDHHTNTTRARTERPHTRCDGHPPPPPTHPPPLHPHTQRQPGSSKIAEGKTTYAQSPESNTMRPNHGRTTPTAH